MIEQTDVFVIGGGPAGLAAAIAARKKGFRVVVADGGAWPIEKACGEGLMPDTVAALRELGVSVGEGEGARCAAWIYRARGASRGTVPGRMRDGDAARGAAREAG